MKLKKILSEVSGNNRTDEIHQFLTRPIIHNLITRGFTFHPFSIGANPDGVWVSHVDFKDDSDGNGNIVATSITGNNLSSVVAKLLKNPINQTESDLYAAIQR